MSPGDHEYTAKCFLKKNCPNVFVQDLVSLEEQLARLKDQAPASGPDGEAGPLGERIAKLKEDAGALGNTTDNMVNALEGKTAKLLQSITMSQNLKPKSFIKGPLFYLYIVHWEIYSKSSPFPGFSVEL